MAEPTTTPSTRGDDQNPGPQLPVTPQPDSEGAPHPGATVEPETTPEAVSDPSEAVATVDSAGVVTLPDGTKVYTRHHPYPMDNTEQAAYELTHSGDQPRYAYVPGDREYSAYADPSIPNSKHAQQVEAEIASYASRVLKDPKAAVSPMWNGLHEVYEGYLKEAIATGGGNSEVEA